MVAEQSVKDACGLEFLIKCVRKYVVQCDITRIRVSLMYVTASLITTYLEFFSSPVGVDTTNGIKVLLVTVVIRIFSLVYKRTGHSATHGGER